MLFFEREFFYDTLCLCRMDYDFWGFSVIAVIPILNSYFESSFGISKPRDTGACPKRRNHTVSPDLDSLLITTRSPSRHCVNNPQFANHSEFFHTFIWPYSFTNCHKIHRVPSSDSRSANPSPSEFNTGFHSQPAE